MTKVSNKEIILACSLGGVVYMLYEYITPKIVSKERKENIDTMMDNYVFITGLQNLCKVFENQIQE